MAEVIREDYVKSTSNIYHVPIKQWRKWKVRQRMVFNEVYSSMVLNQSIYLHPKQEKLSKSHWRTTVWNAAWTAAGAAY